tara:strand:+ start:182 stop:421 length:240 start_codon:yes stop_codon:yes gene_type:complete
MRYRRVLIPGGTYFFTLAIAQRNSALLTSNITLLRYVQLIKVWLSHTLLKRLPLSFFQITYMLFGNYPLGIVIMQNGGG